MMTFMGCFVSVKWSGDLTCLAILAKHEVISSCLEAVRRCSGVGPMGRLARVFTSTPRHRLAVRVDRGSGL